jgi:hypothetical protein
MKILLALAVITILLLLYALWGREWLKSKSWAQPFFAWIEPLEILLFKKSETILFARLLSGLGIVLTFLTQISTIDLTPIMPFVPDKYEPFVRVVFNLMPLVLSGLGAIVEWLRNRTTKPLELVAVPEAALSPEVKVAIAQADEAKEVAVAVVKDKVI